MPNQRYYGHCAKGGHKKEFTKGWVCKKHRGRGGYTHCAGCGRAWDVPITPEWAKCYVCENCIRLRKIAS